MCTAILAALGCLLGSNLGMLHSQKGEARLQEADGSLPQGNERVRALISALDGLDRTFTREQFINRPAVVELVALVDQAAPDLKNAIETSSSWSIRASAAYILKVNGFDRANGYSSLFPAPDPDPIVRAIATGVLDPHDVSRRMEELRTGQNRDPEADRVATALRLDYSPDWLPPEYRQRRLTRLLEIVGTMDPLVPIDIPTAGAGLEGQRPQYDVTPLAQAAKTALLGELHSAQDGDATLQRLWDIVEHERDPLRQGFAAFIMAAARSTEEGAQQPEKEALLNRAIAWINTHAWTEQNQYLLDSMSAFVTSYADVNDAAMKLARQLRSHGNVEVRKSVEIFLKDIEGGKRMQEEAARRRKERIERIDVEAKRHKEQYLKENTKREAEIKAHNKEVLRRNEDALASKVKQSQGVPAPGEDSSTTRTVVWAAGVAVVLLLGGYVVLRRRA